MTEGKCGKNNNSEMHKLRNYKKNIIKRKYLGVYRIQFPKYTAIQSKITKKTFPTPSLFSTSAEGFSLDLSTGAIWLRKKLDDIQVFGYSTPV